MTGSLRRGLVGFSIASVLVVAVPGIALAGVPGGALDPTFSGDGKQTTDLGSTNETAQTVLGLAGGKVLVAGQTGDDIGLVRYTNGGLPDSTFGGGDGIVTASFLGDEDIFNGLSLSSGKIVVIGNTQGSGRSKLAVFRFTGGGVPDATFGGGDGKLAMDLGHDAYGYDLRVLGSGKMIVSGEIYFTNINSAFFVARLRTNGTLDPTFGGGDGFATTQFRAGADGGWRVAVDSQGRIVVGGWAEEGANNGDYDVALARYTPAGKLDTTFSGDGKVITQIHQSGDDWVNGMVLQGTKVVVGAFTNDGSADHFGLLRYLQNGALDASFGGGDGEVISATGTSMELVDLAIDSSGRIVAAGDGNASPQNFIVGRYQANGRLDKSFGEGGFAASDFASPTTADGMALGTGGKILVVGRVDPGDFAVARFLP